MGNRRRNCNWQIRGREWSIWYPPWHTLPKETTAQAGSERVRRYFRYLSCSKGSVDDGGAASPSPIPSGRRCSKGVSGGRWYDQEIRNFPSYRPPHRLVLLGTSPQEEHEDSARRTYPS